MGLELGFENRGRKAGLREPCVGHTVDAASVLVVTTALPPVQKTSNATNSLVSCSSCTRSYICCRLSTGWPLTLTTCRVGHVHRREGVRRREKA